jgi:hypothetical protein
MNTLSKSLLLPLAFFTQHVTAQWNPNSQVNTPVCLASGKQNDARIMEDDNGGAYIAWKDSRNGSVNPDIFIQHVDSAGNMLWTINGIGLCTDTTDQSTPNICTDMNGGAIITWSDRRNNGERDVYAQRINANGTIVWQSNGMPVATKPEREHNEKIVSDGNGGAIVVWEQYDPVNFLWDIWAQRIASNGYPVWAVGGVPLCTVSANRLNPKIQKDKKGGAIITWQDLRNGADYDIYAQRVNSAGTILWGNAGVAIASSAGAQINPKIDPDSVSGGAYIAWADKRNGLDYDIYCQRVDSNGTSFWQSNGVAVAATVGNQSALDMLSNSQINGAIITWKDARTGNEDIYAQKINSAGITQWASNGVPVAVSPFSQKNPNICSDGSTGAIIAWQDSTVNDWDIKVQKVNANGIVQWVANGVVVSDAIEIQSHPKNVPDGKGGTIITFQDKRTNIYDIYCHKICYDGFNVGVTEKNVLPDIKVFPNPFRDNLSVSFPALKGENFSVQIFNLMGEIIFQSATEKNTQNSGQLDFKLNAELPLGIYFLRISDNKKYSRTIKLVKA